MKVTMVAFDILKENHRKIGDRITELSAGRGRYPVFMIEHGLNPGELSELRGVLSRQLEFDPGLEYPQWEQSYLPLLVVTSEIGYRYRGTGTNFWPVVEQDLRITADNKFRSALVDFFKSAHRKFGIARPGLSPWESHFPLIAWPVANALVPLELQPQLARSLQQTLRIGISGNDPDTLYHHLLQIAEGQASRRFENWLQQTDTALEVMRRLLYPTSDGWLSGEILERIDHDLRKDAGASRAIREARHITHRSSKTVRDIPVPPARYVLALTRHVPSHLLVRGPVLSSESREELIVSLCARGDRISAVGSETGIPLHSFLQGGSITAALPKALPDAPLRQSSKLEEPDERSLRILSDLQPRKASFFLVSTGETEAQAIFPGELLPAKSQIIQWMDTESSGTPEFRWLSMTDEADAASLRHAGFLLDAPPAGLEILGLPLAGANSKYSGSFPVLAASGSSGLKLQLDGMVSSQNEMKIGKRDWSVFTPDIGKHWIDDGEADRITFEIFEPSDSEPAKISVDPSLPTLADLENGNLSIRVSSPITLENVQIRLHLTGGEEPSTSAEDVLGRIPCLIRGNSRLLQDIRKQLLKNPIASGRGRLRIAIEGLRPLLVDLLSPVNRLNYDPETGFWSCEDESSPCVPSLVATAESPLPSKHTPDGSGPRLIIAETRDQDALGSGIILTRGKISLTPIQCTMPSFLREAGNVGTHPGVVDLARATVAWKLARCGNVVSDWQRTAIANELESTMTRMLCGDAWQEKEKSLDLSSLASHGALAQCAWQGGLTKGENLPPITSPSDQMQLNSYLIKRFQDEIPDIDLALADWSDDIAERLDLAVIDAYEDLRRHHEELGQETFEEPDMSRPASLWKKVLKEAANMALLPMFKPFILPAHRWNTLVNAWYDELTLDDLVDILDDCHVDSFRRSGFRWMGRSEIRNLLLFWLSPAQVITGEEWAESVAHALSDTQTARAIRYAALRWLTAARDLPETPST